MKYILLIVGASRGGGRGGGVLGRKSLCAAGIISCETYVQYFKFILMFAIAVKVKSIVRRKWV